MIATPLSTLESDLLGVVAEAAVALVEAAAVARVEAGVEAEVEVEPHGMECIYHFQ